MDIKIIKYSVSICRQIDIYIDYKQNNMFGSWVEAKGVGVYVFSQYMDDWLSKVRLGKGQ